MIWYGDGNDNNDGEEGGYDESDEDDHTWAPWLGRVPTLGQRPAPRDVLPSVDALFMIMIVIMIMTKS